MLPEVHLPLMQVYVQDKLRENAEMLIKLLLKGAHLYVCGDASMARDVLHTILNILSNNAAMTEQEARNFVDAMKENGLYHEDIFGVTLRTAEVTDRYRNAARRYVCAHNRKLRVDSSACVQSKGRLLYDSA